MIVFPNCKINLGLQVLQKRTDGYHDLETIFYPLPFQDVLEIIQDKETSLTSSGLAMDVSHETNICYKAWQLLKKDYPGLPSVKIHLHKTIPLGAGLGGGSSDGSFTLILLQKKFHLDCPEEQLMEYALQLGSDCPFFIRNRPCFATGRGEKLEEIMLDLSSYQIILVNPGIHVSTAKVFSKIQPSKKRNSLKEIIQQPIQQWKEQLHNELEDIVFPLHPEIQQIRDELYQQGAIYASMSGSGSSVFGIFNRDVLPQFQFPRHFFVKKV
ncbi:MAG: 4-(cytidine 5'-diphospho)-2-C-methyl-D-erythritol kinase [Flavisolibacter sp.]